jgi:hypothetical protein
MNNNPNDYVTWVYSDEGIVVGRITFNPEDMCRVNSKFFSKNGEIYEHNHQQEEIHLWKKVQVLSHLNSSLPSERKFF